MSRTHTLPAHLLSRTDGRRALASAGHAGPPWHFPRRPFQTWTGMISAREALVQLAIMPIALLVAAIGITVIFLIMR